LREGTPGRILIVNGAEERLQLVLADNGSLVSAKEAVSPGRAMQVLVPEVNALLRALLGALPGGMPGTPRDSCAKAPVDGIACVVGPGSFTSIRLTLATVFGLSRGWSVPLAPIPYLPLLASAPSSMLSGEIWVATHARQRQIYLQAFQAPSCGPLFTAFSPTLEQAKLLLERTAEPPCVLGSGIVRNAEFWDALGQKVRLLDQSWNHPRPDDLVRAAQAATFGHGPLAPIYLRPSDAEENLRSICERRGVQLDEALRHIPRFDSPL
jgi:tRNA threonylcarbamoyladenosine biosynthesis protein TsaB